jgi:cytochrome c biogenesis protein CcdA
MNLCFLIMLPVLLSYSLSRSGSQGVTGNAYAMLGMIAVFITCMACQGEVSF